MCITDPARKKSSQYAPFTVVGPGMKVLQYHITLSFREREK